MYSAMVVDDEQLTREFMERQIPLLNHQWQVSFVASDGQEALEIIREHKVDLIVTDIKMPVMDGLELCAIVSESYPNQKMIILSGHDEFTFAKKALLYGVNDFLLKPIVKEELKETLQRITLEIEEQKNQEIVYKTMRNLSEDSKNHVVKNFLKAVVSESYAEIKVLYPFVFRLKVSLIESEGLVMVLALDEDILMNKSISLSDIPVFKYILNQVVTEIVDETKMGTVFYDQDENTLVLVTGDHKSEIMARCRQIHATVSDVIYKSAAITVTGAIGSPVIDVLQLHASYHKARKVLLSRVVYGGNAIYSDSDNHQSVKFITELDSVIAVIKSGLLDNNDRVYLVSVKKYVELFESFAVTAVFRYGIYMIQSLAVLKRDSIDERTSEEAHISAESGEITAWHLLREFGLSRKTEPAKNETIVLFSEIVKTFAKVMQPQRHHDNEHDIVTKAKEYIYVHFSEPVSLAIIAETIGVSSSYLSNIFHKTINESYIKFLTRVRMEEAAKLLKSKPALKVFDVSEKVGYVSVKHFTYVFKQHFDMPPGEYQDKQVHS